MSAYENPDTSIKEVQCVAQVAMASYCPTFQANAAEHILHWTWFCSPVINS